MSPHAYTEDQLVRQPAIGLFKKMRKWLKSATNENRERHMARVFATIAPER